MPYETKDVPRPGVGTSNAGSIVVQCSGYFLPSHQGPSTIITETGDFRKEYLTRSGSNNNIKKFISPQPKAHKNILGHKLVSYRDKSQKKITTKMVITRNVYRMIPYIVTFRDRTKSKIPRRIRTTFGSYTIWEYPKVSETRFRKSWYLVSKTIYKQVYPLVHRYVTIYGPKKQRSMSSCSGANTLNPNSLSVSGLKLEGFGDTGRVSARPPVGIPPTYFRSIDSGLSGQVPRFATLLWPQRLPADASTWNYLNYGLGSGLLSSYDTQINALELKSRARLFNRVANCDVNLGVALAEASQTAQLLASSLRRLMLILRALRSNRFDKIPSILANGQKGPVKATNLADVWLEIQYGVRPLIADINGALLALSKSDIIEFDVKTSATEVLEGWPEYNTSHPDPPRRTLIMNYTTLKVSHKARCRVTEPGKRVLAELGLTNLSSVIWEKIPYSFIVDWVLPIGKALESLSAFDGITVLYWHTTKSVVTRREATKTFGGVDPQGYIWSSGVAWWKLRSYEIKRTLNSGSLPKPPLPRFKNPFSTEHILNAAALATSFLKVR